MLYFYVIFIFFKYIMLHINVTFNYYKIRSSKNSPFEKVIKNLMKLWEIVLLLN